MQEAWHGQQELAFVPFCVEIEGKYHMMMNCPECLFNSEYEI